MWKAGVATRGRAQMIKELIAELFGGLTTVGIIALTVKFLWGKIWSLAYDAIKEKISLDIDKSRAEFENRLEQQLKRLEQRLEIASHIVKEQYDAEKTSYDKILEYLSTCTSAIQMLKSKLQGEVELSQISYAQNAVRDDVAALEKNYEAISHIICNDIIVSLRRYSVNVRKLISMPIPSTCKFDHGERKEAEQKLREAFHAISDNKEVIQDCIRSRLEVLNQFAKELGPV